MNRPGRVGWARRGSGRAVGLLAVTMAALLTTGCGLFGGESESDSSPDTSANAASGPLEKKELTVGVMVGIDCAGAQLALLNGAFKDEGLTITPKTVQSGQFAIPELAAGGLDITFGNWVSFMKGQGKVADMRFIAESYISTPNSNFGVIAAPESGITSPKDLVGKKVAVNARGNINELLLRAVLEANDVNFDDVTLVEMKFPDMAPALANKEVDAASVIDPFLSGAQKTVGAKIVFDLTGQGVTESFPLSGFAVTKKFADENPNTVAAVQRALLKGQQMAADRSNVQDALTKYAQMDTQTAAIVRIGQFPTTIDAKRLQRVADLMRTYGMLEQDLEVSKLVIPMPASSS